MKNLHLLPTDKASRLCINGKNQMHIYVTSDEEIKEGVDQWYLDKVLNEPYNSGGAQYSSNQDVIILTTDLDLIKDGVQAIDDEFLEWFVKDPSCEEVEVEKDEFYSKKAFIEGKNAITYEYKIIIPQEDSKQEPLSFPLFDKEKSELITKEGQKVVRELQSIIQEETLEEVIKREYEVRKFNSDFPFDPQSFKLGAKWMEKHMEKLKDFETWKEWKNKKK